MDKQQAREIIKTTFENSFDNGQFITFIKNLLNEVEDAYVPYRGNFIWDDYKPHIFSLERIAKYTDGEHQIDILVVKLKKETTLERARTKQRNLIAKYLNGSRGGVMKDAALVAFVSPGETDWRFSLVKMDYRFEEGKNGKFKVKEEFTPSKRWSFLVGSNEASHTAQSRLVPILADDAHKPTLRRLEEAFNIETVTKEFFLKYRELFIRTKEALDKVVAQSFRLRNDFEDKAVDTVNFAKKLLGQIVFLYFLQKKGWFGVERDAEWGTGSKHFLRELFNGKHGNYTNFFNDILEPLFYEALRHPRDDEYYSRFNCKIPFLNGGLFDPIHDYDWVHTDINIPNELFSNNVKTREGDTGNGILDVFDRYNFTVKEDEPLEKDVAIDPELLGKAYEKFNAIRPDNFDEYKSALKSGQKGAENKFNKKFGVYYTPREIVHYMCQQSLINYLFTVTQASSLSNKSPVSSLNSVTPASQPESTSHRQDIPDTIMYFDPNAPIEKRHRNLPHWQQKGVAYFVTFRLYDSIPKEIAEQIREEREQWLKTHRISGPSELKKLSKQIQIEYYRLFSKRYDELLDNGYGSCVLAKPECKQIMEDALKYFEGDRYDLDKYCVMPNHVHVIVIPKGNWTSSQITHSWKSFTSNEINKIVGREGQLWLAESFDHIIRSEAQLNKIREYILNQAKVTHASSVTQVSRAENFNRANKRTQDIAPDHKQDARDNKFHRQDADDTLLHRQDACDTKKPIKEDIETLIKYGDQIGENEEAVKARNKETERYSYKLPESIRQNAELIDRALADITVCDPAIGSGAFLVGMMHEIVKTRNLLRIIQASGLTQASQPEEPEQHRQDACDTYNLKRECIEKSLYSVDIDPGAVEIAKLRLWLSLVVDEEDIRQIKPLPNLDYKIVCGNSLLGYPYTPRGLEKVEQLKERFFDETRPSEKNNLRQEIDSAIYDLFKNTEKSLGYRVNFDFKINFSEVFRKKDGFDVVIANPPYIVLTRNDLQNFNWVKGNQNSYVAFLEVASKYINDAGSLAYIIPSTWLAGNNFKNLRLKLLNNRRIQQIIQLPYDIFDAAYVDNVILILTGQGLKNEKTKTFKFEIRDTVRYRKIKFQEFDSKDWLRSPDSVIFLEKSLQRILDIYQRTPSKLLGEIANIQRGTLPPKESDLLSSSEYTTKQNLIRWFTGQVYRYVIVNGPEKFVLYEKLKENKPLEVFSGSRILGRQLVSRQFRLQFTFVAEDFAFKKNLYAIYHCNKYFTYYYLLAILNSRFFSHVQVKLNASGQRDDYPAFSLQDFRNFKIPIISLDKQKPFVHLVDHLLAITKDEDYLQDSIKQTKVKELEREIDQMVYKLYCLTEEEIRIVEGKNS